MAIQIIDLNKVESDAQVNVIDNAVAVDIQNTEVVISGVINLGVSEAHIGQVGGNAVLREFTPTISGGSYVTGDYVGKSNGVTAIADCSRVAGGTGTIISAILIDKDLASIAGELWLYDTAITPPADSAPWTISDADQSYLTGIIPFTNPYYSALQNSVEPEKIVGLAFKCVAGSTSLYPYFVTRGSPAYTVSGLLFRLLIWQD